MPRANPKQPGWPSLRALLGVESGRDILLALLAPSPRQDEALKGSEAWVAKARDLLKTSLGLALKTRGFEFVLLRDAAEPAMHKVTSLQ